MIKLKSCGIFCLRNPEDPEFLLMEHQDRLDFPKGHVDAGETEIQCALREWHEETGVPPDALSVVDGYRYETHYIANYKRRQVSDSENGSQFAGGDVDKTLVMFAAWLPRPREITLTEHLGFRWVAWNPPHAIQELSVDPLLADVNAHWDLVASGSESAPDESDLI